MFSGVFREYKMKTLARYGVKKCCSIPIEAVISILKAWFGIKKKMLFCEKIKMLMFYVVCEYDRDVIINVSDFYDLQSKKPHVFSSTLA